MRSSTPTTRAAYLSLLLLPISALQIPSILAPFYEPYIEIDADSSILLSNTSLSSSPQQHHDLLKRDGNCPLNFNSCSTFRDSAGGACCTAGSFCTTDRARNIACCPTGATCTGSLDIATATTTGTGIGGGAVFGTGTGTTTTTGTTATITTPPTITDSTPVTYVANAFFPFPYIPTTYANSAACNSAFQACQTNYAACTSALDGSGANAGGAGFGVTIVAPNGGITASPTIQSLGVASATSICSSLSAQGCYNIVSDNCAQFGTGTEVNFVPGTTGNGAAMARATGGCFVGVMAGLGLGIAGQII
ncbi:hypothetical protein BKA65DRAFT_47334 [Rhexocercosporidium sp. MPI-PUGE-AT-0058]|nr:hypothetical protein BKA65DRAFT_47334 [Rhexocercosporidium sp. MPI-PUGE-AT-0058]